MPRDRLTPVMRTVRPVNDLVIADSALSAMAPLFTPLDIGK